jgi:hypothetical protein
VDRTNGRHERDGDRRPEPVPPKSHDGTLSRALAAPVANAGYALPRTSRSRGHLRPVQRATRNHGVGRVLMPASDATWIAAAA